MLPCYSRGVEPDTVRSGPRDPGRDGSGEPPLAGPLACLDAAYTTGLAVAACVLFQEWEDRLPSGELVRSLPAPASYQSGMLVRRELPALLEVLGALQERPALVVVDAYVWLDAHGRPGLGAHLWAALHGRCPVVGVAKRPFRGAPAVPVWRGASRRPLLVTAAGVDPCWAAERVAAMHGAFRIPTLLAYADRLSRQALLSARGP